MGHWRYMIIIWININVSVVVVVVVVVITLLFIGMDVRSPFHRDGGTARTAIQVHSRRPN